MTFVASVPNDHHLDGRGAEPHGLQELRKQLQALSAQGREVGQRLGLILSDVHGIGLVEAVEPAQPIDRESGTAIIPARQRPPKQQLQRVPHPGTSHRTFLRVLLLKPCEGLADVLVRHPFRDPILGAELHPSEWRPGLAIWGFSEARLLRHEEYASPREWLLELLEPFATDEAVERASSFRFLPERLGL